MLIISPRSYVTAAFDLIFPDLLEYVFEKMSINQRWWNDIVCEGKEDIFKNNNDVRNKVNKDFLPDYYVELYDYFDEHSLCKLVLSDFAKNFILKHDIVINTDIFEELQKIRVQWAHRKYKQIEYYDDEKPKREWAESTILYIREIAKFLEEYDTETKISILLFKMKCDWIDDDTQLPSHKKLIDWIENNIIKRVIALDSPVDDEIKRRVEKSFDNLKKYVAEASDSTASRYVIDYYWNAIRGKTDVYKKIEKHTNTSQITTFENSVKKFTDICYGK